LGVVAGLAWGEQDRQRPATSVDGEVDLRAQPASGPADGLAIFRTRRRRT
jgi:hypothetical protein